MKSLRNVSLFILLSYGIYQDIFHGFSSILGLIVSIIFVVFIHIMAARAEELNSMYRKESQERKKAMDEATQLKKQIGEYESLFTTFEEIAFFVIDKKSQTGKFSVGTEQLFGYSPIEVDKDISLLTNLVHKEDRRIVEEMKEKIDKGEFVKSTLKIEHPTQGEKWIRVDVKPLNEASNRIYGYCLDITKQKKLENDLRHMAFFDDLTDLPNRKLLDRHIQKALARSKRHNHTFTLMFIDLDDFKLVNDTLGHHAGDELLQEVAGRINENIRDEDLLARIGGDEFIVVFEETSKTEIEEIAQRIIKAVSLPYELAGSEANISLSIGVSMYPDDGEDKETLIENADKAMYYAKKNGKNNYHLYEENLVDLEVEEDSIFSKWMKMLQVHKLFK